MKVIDILPLNEIKKAMTMRGPGYATPAILILEDGSRIDYHLTTTRKKDMPGKIERTRRTIAAGAMKCENGAIIEQFVFSGSGLVPMAH